MEIINGNTKVALSSKLFAPTLPYQMTITEYIFVLNEHINVTLISTYQFLDNNGPGISLKEDTYWNF